MTAFAAEPADESPRALITENLAVDPEQIFPLHAGLARNTSDQQRPINIAKAFIEICSGHYRLKQRKGAIVQFHYDAIQRAERVRNFDQMEYERLVRPEHLSRGDAEQKCVTNLPSGASHGDLNRCLHDAISHKRFGEQSQSA